MGERGPPLPLMLSALHVLYLRLPVAHVSRDGAHYPLDNVHHHAIHETLAEKLVVLPEVDPRADDGKRPQEQAHAQQRGHQV